MAVSDHRRSQEKCRGAQRAQQHSNGTNENSKSKTFTHANRLETSERSWNSAMALGRRMSSLLFLLSRLPPASTNYCQPLSARSTDWTLCDFFSPGSPLIISSDRMFKSRLSAWGFSKNSHDREYQICARLHKIRKESGKHETLFIINKDTKRSLRDLRKYIKGRKMSEDAFVASAEENVSDEQLASDQTVRAMTPPAEGGLDDRDSEHEGGPEMENAAPGYPAKISTAPPFLSHRNTHSHTSLMHLKHENSSPSSSNAFSSSGAAVRDLLSSLPVSAAQSQFQPQQAAASPTTPASMSSSSHSMAFSHGHSPRRRRRSSCQYFDQHDVDVMAYQTVHCNSLPSTYGTNDLDGWKLLQR